MTDAIGEKKEEAKEENKLVQFVDSKGRIYTPHVTSRVVRVLEESMGEGVFEQLYQVLAAQGGKPDGSAGIDDVGMFKIGQKLFGSMSRLVRLLFESCREYDGSLNKNASAIEHTKSKDEVEIAKPVDVTFDDFEQSITGKEVADALKVGLIAFWDFFPSIDDLPTGAGGEGGSSDPRRLFAGKTYSR